jgi:cytochrome c-type biogenesis protein
MLNVGSELLVGAVFVAGLASFFAPCIIPLLPVYVAHLSGGDIGITDKKGLKLFGKLSLNITLIVRTAAFVGGLSTVFVVLGFGAGILGGIINSTWFIRGLGLIVILLGVHQTGLIKLNFLEREKKVSLNGSHRQDLLGAYILGLTFSFGWTPCIGPVLGSVLAVSASEGSALYGGFLMFIYALGLLIPFMLIAIFSDILLKQMKHFNKYLGLIKLVGGIIIIAMGLLLMTNQLNVLTALFEG